MTDTVPHAPLAEIIDALANLDIKVFPNTGGENCVGPDDGGACGFEIDTTDYDWSTTWLIWHDGYGWLITTNDPPGPGCDSVLGLEGSASAFEVAAKVNAFMSGDLDGLPTLDEYGRLR